LHTPSSWCLDIRTEFSNYTSCYTKSYSRYIKGTGSVLLFSTGGDSIEENLCQQVLEEREASERQFDPSWWEKLQSMFKEKGFHVKLRYFTPVELLRVFGFPPDFQFPSNISIKKQYELIGNSVNVRVIELLLKELFSETLRVT
jgi:tRNA (cytosine38-C5)-methyltransferase